MLYPDENATMAIREKYKDTLRSLGVGAFLFEDRESPGSFVAVKIVVK